MEHQGEKKLKEPKWDTEWLRAMIEFPKEWEDVQKKNIWNDSQKFSKFADARSLMKLKTQDIWRKLPQSAS